MANTTARPIGDEVSRQQIGGDPFGQVGVVFVEFPNGEVYSGTFSVVGRNDVLTAGHLLFNPNRGGAAVRAEFYLGADYNKQAGRFEFQPHPTFSYTPASGRLLHFAEQTFADADHTTFLTTESAWDVALVGLDQPIGDRAGWLGLNPGVTADQSAALSIGYPGGATGMLSRTVDVVRGTPGGEGTTGIWSEGRLDSTRSASLSTGDSGGPLLVDGQIVGVASASAGGGVQVGPGLIAAMWARLDLTYDRLVMEMAQNDVLLGGAPQGVGDSERAGLLAAGRVMRGGRGADVLRGTEGADTFVFDDPAGLSAKAKQSDSVVGFVVQQGDRIDLRGLGESLGIELDYVGSQPSSQPNGDVWFARGLLQISTDGDSAAEAVIRMVGVKTLPETALVV